MSVLTKAIIIDLLSDEVDLNKSEAKRFLRVFLSEIIASLLQGNTVKLPSLGNFTVMERKQRVGRNPHTGEKVTIAPRRVVVFRPGRKLKNKVASSG